MANRFLSGGDEYLDIDMQNVSDTGKQVIEDIVQQEITGGGIVISPGPLSGLTDVLLSSPQNTQVLTYNSSNGRWTNQAPAATNPLTQDYDLYTRIGGVAARLPLGSSNTLLGVTNTGSLAYRTLTTGQGISLNISNSNLSYSLSPTPSGTNTVLTFDGTSLSWSPVSGGSLAALTDCSINTPTNGQYLRYNSTSQRWFNTASFLSDQSDVSILVQPGNRDALVWESAGQRWISNTIQQQMTNILTTTGSIPYGAAGSVLRLPIGTNGQVLTVVSGLPAWANASGGSSTLASLTDVNVLTVADKNLLSYDTATSRWIPNTCEQQLRTVLTTAGDLVYRISGNVARLPVGTTGQVLQVSAGGLPQWATVSGVSPALSTLIDVNLTSVANNNILTYNTASSRWVNSNTATLQQLNIQSTQIEDYRMRVNNAFSNYSIQDSTGTNTWLQTSSAGLSVNGRLIALTSGSTPATNSTLRFNGTSFTPVLVNLSSLNDVALTSIQNLDILSYNTATSKFINSNRLTTVERNNLISTVANPTTYTFSYNQTDYPIVRSSYTQGVMLPLNGGSDASSNTLYLNSTSGSVNPSAGSLGNVYSGLTMQQAITKLWNPTFTNFLGGPYSTGRESGWFYPNAGFVFRINVNLSQNTLNPGTTYDMRIGITGTGGSQDVFFWGLKNSSIVTSEMATLTALNTGNVNLLDYDLLYTIPTTTGILDTWISVPINPANTYYAVVFSSSNMPRLAWWTIINSSASTVSYTIPSSMTFSNASGSLALTNVSPKSSESWQVYGNNLLSYYLSTIVAPVIRTIGEIRLNSSIFEDYRCRISNALGNSFSFQNITGTTTLLTVDANNTKVIVPNNAFGMLYSNSTTGALTSITTLNTYATVVMPAGVVITTNNGAFTAGTNSMVCNVGGRYKIAVHANINFGDGNTLFIQLQRNGTLLNGGQYITDDSNNSWTGINIVVIALLSAGDVITLAATKTAGAVPKTLSLASFSIIAENLFTS